MATAIRTGTVTITPEIAAAIGMIGAVVTHRDRQYTVRQVEGPTWYTFLATDGTIKVDLGFPLAYWIPATGLVGLIPAGCEFGEGFMIETQMSQIKRGVSLAKTGI